MDRRALPGLFGGLAACAFAVVGAVSGSPVPTILGASCALVAAASTLVLVERGRAAENRAAIASIELAAVREAEAAAKPSGVIDRESGLPDARFFEVALETRVSAARRHLWPVTIVLVEITAKASTTTFEVVTAFSTLIRQTLREADIVCRIGLRTFALVLEDTNESGGVWAAERIQAAVAKEQLGIARAVAGVATYPTHGLATADVFARARTALAKATVVDPGAGLGAIEVASVDVSERRD